MPGIHHNSTSQRRQTERRQMDEFSRPKCVPARRAFMGQYTARKKLESQHHRHANIESSKADRDAEQPPMKSQELHRWSAEPASAAAFVQDAHPAAVAMAVSSAPGLQGSGPKAEPPEFGRSSIQPQLAEPVPGSHTGDDNQVTGHQSISKDKHRPIPIASRDIQPANRKKQRIVDAQKSVANLIAAGRNVAEQHSRELTALDEVNSKAHRSEQHYLVQWADSIIAKHLIMFEAGKITVTIDGQNREVQRSTFMGQDATGAEFYSVEWVNSWVPESELADARHALAEYQAQRESRSVTSTNDARSSPEPAADEWPNPRSEAADRIIEHAAERDTHAQRRTTPPVDDRIIEHSWQVDTVQPPHPQILKLIFQPEAGKDYRDGLRELIERTMGADCPAFKKWPSSNDKRELCFTAEFVSKRLPLDLTRMDRLNAAFAHIAGEKQQRPCEACRLGNGPFESCVVVSGFAKGACTNCASYWHSRTCNYHVNSTEDQWMPAKEILHHRAPSLLPFPVQEPSPKLEDLLTPPPTQASSSIEAAFCKSQVLLDPLPKEHSQHIDPESPDSEFEFPTLENVGQTRQSKRRASSAFSPPPGPGSSSTHVDSSPCRNTRASKARRSANTVSAQNEPQVKVESTTHPVHFQPLSFRHAGCGAGEDRPCQKPDLVPQAESTSGLSRFRGRVISDRIFKPGEASDDEVRFVLSCAPCYFVESIHSAWQARKFKCDSLWTRESFASRHFSLELNVAVQRYCPRRQRPKDDHVVILLD